MYQEEDNVKTYSSLAEKFKAQRQGGLNAANTPVEESYVEETSVPEYLSITDPAESEVPEMLRRPEPVQPMQYGSLAEKFGRDIAAETQFGDIGSTADKPTLGELSNRFIITASEAFNRPFKAAGRFMWEYSVDPATMVAKYLHERKEGEGDIPEFLQDQSLKLAPATTTSERVIDIAGETFGATLSMFLPSNAGAQVYARTHGLSRVAGQASAFERGVPSGTLLDRKALEAYTARTARQKVRAEADQAREAAKVGESTLRTVARNVGRRAQDAPGKAVEAAQAVAQAPRAIARSYIDEPVTNATIEIIGATGAGAGAGLMEAIFPGSLTGRIAGEMAGGFFLPPGALLLRAGQSPVKRLIGYFSKDERHKVKLAQLLTNSAKQYFKEQGRDYSDEAVNAWRNRMIEALESTPNENYDLTPGQITGDPILLGFEANIASRSKVFRQKREENLQNAYNYLDNIIAGVLRTGDPESLRLAAAARYAADKNAFDGAIMEAQREFSEAIGKLDFTDSAKADASLRAKDIVQKVYDAGIAAQKKAWGLVSANNALFEDAETLRTIASNTFSAERYVKGEVTVTKGMPFSADFKKLRRAYNYRVEYQRLREAGDTEGIKELNKKTPKSVRNYRVKDLINLRSDLLTEARSLRATGQNERALLHNRLAKGILDDLDGIADLNGNYAYLRANALSKAFNDAFADNFLARIVTTDERGNPLIDPQAVLDEAFGTGGRRGRERLAALYDIAEFKPEEAIRPVGGEVETFGFNYQNLGKAILDAEEAFLRGNLTRLVNANGEITPASLNNFLKNQDNRRILSTMPRLRNDLRNIETARVRVEEAKNDSALKREHLENSAFSNLVGDVHPSKAIAGILAQPSGTVTKKIKELAELAGESGEVAMNGLQRALLDFANKRAGASFDADGMANLRRMPYFELKKALTEPIATGVPSIKKLLLDNKIMTQEAWDNYMQMVDEGVRLEEIIASPGAIEALSGTVSPYTDLAIRLAGAKFGAGVAAMSPGGAFQGQGLVAAGAGVRLAQNIFAKTPLAKLEALQIEAARDTKFMKNVLMARYTPENKAQLTREINLFLIHAGMLPLTEGPYDEEAVRRPTSFDQRQQQQ